MKKCFKCKKTKTLENFYKHPQMADGHIGKCKSCTKNDVSKNYFANRSHYVEYEKNRFKDPKRKIKLIEYQRKRRSKSPGKNRARMKVREALNSGILIKGVCNVCGDDNTEAHHTDYRKYLDVVWLCRRHHLAEHNKIST